MMWRAVAIALVAVQALAGIARSEETARLLPGASAIADHWTHTQLDLALSRAVPYRLFTLARPDRLVIDFNGADLGSGKALSVTGSAAVSGVAAGPLMPGWSRLVFVLTRPMAVASAVLAPAAGAGHAVLSVRLRATEREAFDAAAGDPGPPGWRLPEPVRPPAPVPDDSRHVVVLDPGHGGIDPGAEREGLREADLMLTLAREVAEILASLPDMRVVLTREDDRFVSLERRITIAREAGADLFVSLHADALPEGQARGATVFVLDEKASDAASAALAERHDRSDILSGVDLAARGDDIAAVLIDLARADTQPRSRALARHLVTGIERAVGYVYKHPLRGAGFSVLKAADIPSVLIEVGFLSTESERRNIADPAWRQRFARGVAEGILSWLAEDAARTGLRLR